MSPPASSSEPNWKSNLRTARDRAAITFALSLAFLAGMTWYNIANQYALTIKAAMQADVESDVVVLSVANAEISATADVAMSSSDDNGAPRGRAESCQIENTAALLLLELPADSGGSVPFTIAPRTGHDTLHTTGVMTANASNAGGELASCCR